MKLRLLTIFLALVLVMNLAGCSAAGAAEKLDAAGDQVENKLDSVENTVENALRRSAIPGPTEATSTITQAQAENIALNHAGFTADQVTGLRTAYEVDEGVPQYDVEFHEGDWEYEFEISAEDGRILSFDKDHKYD